MHYLLLLTLEFVCFTLLVPKIGRINFRSNVRTKTDLLLYIFSLIFSLFNDYVTMLGKHLTRMSLLPIAMPRQTSLIDHGTLFPVSLDTAT